MKKKGFTLVELLAVIAILAILVIVAMPNVLGMFNQAKSSTFVTEIQEYMSSASTKFMTEALKPGNQGKTLYFGNGTSFNTDYVNLSTLDMSGAEKQYFIEVNRNGEFVRVIIYDSNFCYDSDKAGLAEDFNKTDIVVDNVYEKHDNDTVNVTSDGMGGWEVIGCKGTVKAQ